MRSQMIYSCDDLIMRCNMDEPFCGAIDDGNGTIAYVSTDVLTKIDTYGSYVFYEKRISLKIDKVTYIIKQGDNLTNIAKRFNASIEEIASSNGIKDSDYIKAGDVLSVTVDIKYGYQVSGMIDTMNFSPKARENGYAPISEMVIYKILDQANSAADNFAESLVKNAGKTRAGNNFKFYFEKPSGNVFQGNQYVKTYGLKEVGSSISKYTKPLNVGRVAIPLAVAIEGVEIYDGWQQDGQTFGYNTQKQIVGAAGAITGAAIGAKYLAIWGLALGGIPGAIIGGFVGGIVGGIVGELSSEEAFECLDKKFTE